MTNLPQPRVGAALRVPARGFPIFYGRMRRERVLVRDVWEYLRHESHKRLKGKYRERASAFVDQAFEFYEAAANPRLSSRPLLYYYCFLNLAKVALLCDGTRFPPKLCHGLNDPRGNSTITSLPNKFVAWSGAARDQSEIFPELIRAFSADRKTYSAADKRAVLELLRQVPAIHRTYCKVRQQRPTFIPVEELDLRRGAGETWVHLRCRKPRADLAAACKALYKSTRFTSFFTKVRGGDADDTFDSIRVAYRHRGLEKAIADLAVRLRHLGVWHILAGSGYLLYLSSHTDPLPQWCSSYAAMFFLGSLTRYKPYDFDRLTNEYSWLISEFIDTCPEQMLYTLASHICESEVVVPWAVST